jgi:hypothetical protein
MGTAITRGGEHRVRPIGLRAAGCTIGAAGVRMKPRTGAGGWGPCAVSAAVQYGHLDRQFGADMTALPRCRAAVTVWARTEQRSSSRSTVKRCLAAAPTHRGHRRQATPARAAADRPARAGRSRPKFPADREPSQVAPDACAANHTNSTCQDGDELPLVDRARFPATGSCCQPPLGDGVGQPGPRSTIIDPRIARSSAKSAPDVWGMCDASITSGRRSTSTT